MDAVQVGEGYQNRVYGRWCIIAASEKVLPSLSLADEGIIDLTLNELIRAVSGIQGLRPATRGSSTTFFKLHTTGL